MERPPLTGPWGQYLIPPTIDTTVDASPTWWQDNTEADAATVAGQIIESYGSQLRQFFSAQRQAVAAGIVAVQRRMVTLPGLDVFYMSQQGRETIHYVVRPESYVAPQPTTSGGILLDLIAVEFFDGAS